MTPSSGGGPVASAQRRVLQAFREGGCVRTPDETRLEEGHRTYKKGWEVRFTLRSKPEIAALRRLLRDADLVAGSWYRKSKGTWILPVYGREQVARFLGWLERAESA